MAKVRNKAQKLRFGGVGSIATAIDFGILFFLHALGFVSIGANFVSTGAGFIFSFFANRHYTFRASSGSARKQLILFFIFTFIGIWVYQPVIIWGIENMIDGFNYPDWLDLLIAKLVATAVTLVWNYLTYAKIVFKEDKEVAL